MNQPNRNQPSMNLLGTNQRNMNQASTSLSDRNQLDMKQAGMNQPDPKETDMSQPRSSQPGPYQKGKRLPRTWKQSINQPGVWAQDMKQLTMSQPQPGPNQHNTIQSTIRQPSPSESVTSKIDTRSAPSQVAMRQPDFSHRGVRFPGRSELGLHQPSMDSFLVRPAEPRDCPEILRLIKELAACENMLYAVKLTATDLIRDGFGDKPLFYCLIAEVYNEQKPPGKVVVGFAMYYFAYDPWIGKLLYLEDFYVIQAYRGLGIGAELLKRLSQIAIRSQCSCMHFLVVIWNQASIDYYTRRGALDLSSEEGWHLFRFNREELMHMARGE